MKRAVARGRMFPQSYSTDRRIGGLSLMACALFPLMWVNCDDQGRLTGNPDEIKYATCPNIDHITKGDIPELLKELQTQELIKVYSTSKVSAIQMLDWWEVQRLQWAYPSQYPPPEGWQDRLRYHASPTEVVTENWPAKSDLHSNSLPSALPNPLGKEQLSNEKLGEEIRAELMTIPYTIDPLVEHEVIKETLAKLGRQKGLLPKSEITTDVGRVDLVWEGATAQIVAAFEIDIYEPKRKSMTKLKALACSHSFVILRSNPEPFQWEQDILLIGLGRARGENSESRRVPLPPPEIKKEEEGRTRRGRGNLPSALGSTSPSLTADTEIFKELTRCFKIEWGRVPAQEPHKVIRREPNARESAQLRDLAKNLSAVGGVPLDYIKQAFREAASHDKRHISYVRAILLDWLGVPRGPPSE